MASLPPATSVAFQPQRKEVIQMPANPQMDDELILRVIEAASDGCCDCDCGSGGCPPDCC